MMERLRDFLGGPDNRKLPYRIGDALIGFDDGVETGGERLGKGINDVAKALYRDPFGTAGNAVNAVTSDLNNLMFEGGAMERPPVEMLGYATGMAAPGMAFGSAPAGALRSVIGRTDSSNIFGPGTSTVRYGDEATGGYMDVLQRPDGPSSTLELLVPEGARNQGGGKRLLAEAMAENPWMMGQVSSKAAARNAYAAGRRPFDNPDATLEDVFRMIDEDSSVNLVIDNRPMGDYLK